MEKILIDKNKPLNPGDIIEMHFTTTGMFWLNATQIALIEWQMEKRKDFRLLSHSLPAGNSVIFTIQITEVEVPSVYKAGAAVTAAIIGAAIIGAGVVAWLTLDKVLQIIESPKGKDLIEGVALTTTAVVILAILILLRK